MGEKVEIDYEKLEVKASLMQEEPIVILISNGNVRMVKLPSHGDLSVTTHGGNIKHFKTTESHLF